MVIYFTGNFTGVLEYIKETFWMLPVSIIKKKYFRGLSTAIYNSFSPCVEKSYFSETLLDMVNKKNT